MANGAKRVEDKKPPVISMNLTTYVTKAQNDNERIAMRKRKIIQIRKYENILRG